MDLVFLSSPVSTRNLKPILLPARANSPWAIRPKRKLPSEQWCQGDHYRKVLSYFEQIDPADASILCGGKPATVEGHEQGFYIEPTVIEVQNNQCRLNQEEIFGPVVTLMPFENEEELIAMANDVKYGLSATIWTKDLDRTMRLSKKIECGVVWINTWLMRDLRTPFGGMKNSGVGREGGLEALRFFTEPKNICIAFED